MTIGLSVLWFYFERIILPLLNFPQNGHILDVGYGNGGLSLLLAEFRPDLVITGIDSEPRQRSMASSARLC